MRLLNVGCGNCRPGPPWINLDNLHDQLKPGTPERINLDKEMNYVDHNIATGSVLPFDEESFDGVLCSHVVEHFDCIEAALLLSRCRTVLKHGGLLVVSVPDADHFLDVYHQDTPENAVRLFGEPICPDEPWHKSFFDYALFYHQHKQVLTHGSVSCLLVKAGFSLNKIFHDTLSEYEVGAEIEKIMNRRRFSLELCALK